MSVELTLRVIIGICLIIMAVGSLYGVRYMQIELKASSDVLTPSRQLYLRHLIESYVVSAEQVYRDQPRSGQKKKAYVLGLVKEWEQLYGDIMPPSTVTAMIEAAVYSQINGPTGTKTMEAIRAKSMEVLGVDTSQIQYADSNNGDWPNK